MLRYNSAEGRPQGLTYNPDFFVIETARAGWLECKFDALLGKLAAKMPSRYVRRENREWKSSPGEVYAEHLGLF